MKLENLKGKYAAVKVDIPNVLMAVFVVCVLLNNLIPIPGLLGNALIAGSGCLMFLYTIICKKEDKKVWKITGLAVVMSICMIASSLYNHNASLKEILWIWCYMGAALVISYFDIDDRWISALFYLLSGYFFLCIIMQRSVHYILYSTSRNGISLLMHFVLFLLYICRGSRKRVLYLPAAFCLIISVWSLGRAGVLTSIFFLGGIAVYGLVKEKKSSLKKLLGIAFLLVVSMLLLAKVFPTNESLKAEDVSVTDNQKDSEMISEQEADINKEEADVAITPQKKSETFVSRFSAYGLKSVRTSIWAEYISKMVYSGKNFLLGVDCLKGTFLSQYRQPHNSYLELHAKFGMTGFLITMILLAGTFIKLCRDRNGLYLLVFIACGMRAMLDWVAFPGCIDVMFWFLCFQKMFGLENISDRNAEERLLTESMR